MGIGASAGLHGPSGLKACDAIGRNSLFIKLRVDQGMSVRIVSRQVEEVYAGKDDQETTEQGNGVDGIGSVESLEKDE